MSLQTSTVAVPRAGGTGVMDSFFVKPDGAGLFPGVVVIHEIFGLNDNIRGIDSLCGAGLCRAWRGLVLESQSRHVHDADRSRHVDSPVE